MAFGSLIIAIIRMLRTILEYIEGKLKKFNNDLTRCLICICKCVSSAAVPVPSSLTFNIVYCTQIRCFLWCLEKFMRFINRNAYIMCAIKGTNFCVSAKVGLTLLSCRLLICFNVSD